MNQSLTEQVLRKGKNKQKGGGTKKHGRNASKCKYYRDNRYRKNKLAKLLKHCSVHVNDTCAAAAFERLMVI
jgi:hypothetical protein